MTNPAEGWGRRRRRSGMHFKACNCTDFHSLFIGMMRSSGIPARFEIGFRSPKASPKVISRATIAGRIPSRRRRLGSGGCFRSLEESRKRDFFFGAHDTNRVFFTYGRDIRLSSDQKADPLKLFYLSLRGDEWPAGEKPANTTFPSATFRQHSSPRQAS